MSLVSLRALEAVLDDPSVLFARRAFAILIGVALWGVAAFLALSLATWTVSDPSLTHATSRPVQNMMGWPGAAIADPFMQLFGIAAPVALVAPLLWGFRLLSGRPLGLEPSRIGAGIAALLLAPALVHPFPVSAAWPLPVGLGGVVGEAWLGLVSSAGLTSGAALGFAGGLMGLLGVALFVRAVSPVRATLPETGPGFQIRRHNSDSEDEYGLDDTDTFEAEPSRWSALAGAIIHHATVVAQRAGRLSRRGPRRVREPRLRDALARHAPDFDDDPETYRRSASAPEKTPLRPAQAREPIEADMPPAEPSIESPSPAVSRKPPEPYQAQAKHVPTAPAVARTNRGGRQNWAFHLPSRGPAAKLAAAAVIGATADDRTHSPEDPSQSAIDDRSPQPGPLEDPLAAQSVHNEAMAHDGFDAASTDNEEPPAADDWQADDPDEAWTDQGIEDEWDDGNDLADEDWADDTQIDGRDEPDDATARQSIETPVHANGRVVPVAAPPRPAVRQRPRRGNGTYAFPPLALLSAPPENHADDHLSEDALEANARLLEGVLEDFGVRGSIIEVRPGPVVTLYELEPAPGIKSSRVIGLADDIARSMSAISARVAVIPGKNAIGIELPNRRRITVFLREILGSEDFAHTRQKLPLCLGKTIGGEAVIADLARMPHLLVAGTTGSGKSVSINTMILSLLYHHKPERCRVILIDPKMLELSVYDDIPHLLTPVVTDPKKAVSALRWAVREMEDRYRKMAKLGVRNIDGYNTRLKEAQKTGEPLTRLVQTGFDKQTGEAIFEEEVLSFESMPYIVVIVDEMADLMMVAGKEIEGAIQRLAQMARAAGIHLIMATQRPSVDVITGTIKANFPTRISFAVTSKIDSRTILGEMGAEQLLGMGDMLYMAGGGRIQRVHGPFVSDEEVEDVVDHLKEQGVPAYLDEVLEEDGEAETAGGAPSGLDALSESDDLYDRAVALVLRDRKASTSYVQRRLSIGYNRAATLIERMENEGVVSPANHAGKREILVPAEEDA